MDNGWLDRLFQTFGLKVAAWVGLLMVGVHWLRAHNERLRDKATEHNGSFARMQELAESLSEEIKRLDERCDHLQREVDECRRREGEWMSRAIAAEAALLGEGDARQAAQRIVSTERQIDAEKRDRDDA